MMVIGPSRCGKTSLVNVINDYDGPLRRTQDLIYGKRTMDVPGAYIENPWMYKHLIAAAQDAFCVLLLVDQARCHEVYSPGFAKAFRIPVVGVITKCDRSPENNSICRRQLSQIGVSEPYFSVSVPEGIGINELKQYLEELSREKGGEE